MQEAETMLAEYATYGTTSFVVKAQMCIAGREREFKFPNSDAPLWILEYAIRGWVLEMKGEREYSVIGIHLMLGDTTLNDVYDEEEEPEEISLSSIFVNGAIDGENVLKVVLDTERLATIASGEETLRIMYMHIYILKLIACAVHPTSNAYIYIYIYI
jgi:hypothetical protein